MKAKSRIQTTEAQIRKNILETLEKKLAQWTLPAFSNSFPVKDAKDLIRHPLRLRRDKMFQVKSMTKEYKKTFERTREHEDPDEEDDYNKILTSEAKVYYGLMEAYVNFKFLRLPDYDEYILKEEPERVATYFAKK